jgi:nucleotide-binding universal stress UspA family protein
MKERPNEMIRTIFVPLAAELSGETLLDAALTVAKRVNSHICALFIMPNPDTTFAYLPDMILAAGVTREVIGREMKEAAVVERDRFVDWRNRNDVPEAASVRLDSCFATWSEQMGEIETLVTRYGRLSDLIMVQRPTPGFVHAQRCFDAAVFGSGRPTLVVGEKLPFDMTDHVIIAWNGSLEASRAVLGAMPLLHLASRVSIFAAPQYADEGVDPADLIDALRWHGIRAHPVVGPKDDNSVGAALVSAAAEQQATLIVMGAYTHSRLRQSFLGGVTRHLLGHAPIPLLMTH